MAPAKRKAKGCSFSWEITSSLSGGVHRAALGPGGEQEGFPHTAPISSTAKPPPDLGLPWWLSADRGNSSIYQFDHPVQGFVSSPSAKVIRSGAEGYQLPGTAPQQNCDSAQMVQEIEHPRCHWVLSVLLSQPSSQTWSKCSL